MATIRDKMGQISPARVFLSFGFRQFWLEPKGIIRRRHRPPQVQSVGAEPIHVLGYVRAQVRKHL